MSEQDFNARDIDRGLRLTRSTAQVAYFCPQCQSIDVEVLRPTIIDPIKKNGGATFSCPLCKATGDASELIGALSPENKEFWNTERVGRVMLHAGTKLAAGPMLQVLELIGLLPKLEGSEEQQKSAAQVRESVAKAVISSFIEAAFSSCAELAVPHFEKFDENPEASALLKEGTTDVG